MMSLTFSLFTQVSGSGPLGPLVKLSRLIPRFSLNYMYFISWPTLIFFEVACSLTVLDCTLRKIQPNIQGGVAKL